MKEALLSDPLAPLSDPSVDSSTDSSSEESGEGQDNDAAPLEADDEDLEDHEIIGDMFEGLFEDDPIGGGEEEGVDARFNQPTGKHWDQIKYFARTPLFDNARISIMSTILLLFNIQRRFGMSDVCLSALYKVFAEKILPEGNHMPRSRKEAKLVLTSIGMGHELIHACPNDCILYRKEFEQLEECPKCSTKRYREDTRGLYVPKKVLRWFPLIPRLLHAYRCRDLAELQRWHASHRSNDGIMRLVVDSPAVQHIEDSWHEFRDDPRHIRLGIATDGVSPYSTMQSKYSVWPVVIMNYNIPPWLAMKKEHLMLSLIIPGPKQATKVDTYLAPLVEELQELWSGVDAYDSRVSTHTRDRHFKLKAICMWTMHDYPGFGYISGLQTKGYMACPTCGPDLEGHRPPSLKKIVYMGHSKYLPLDHEMRQGDNHPIPRCTDAAYWVDLHERIIEDSTLQHRSGLSRWSIFWTLPYWKDLKIRHLLDPMHIEGNVAKSLIHHIIGNIDGPNVRDACEFMGVHEEAWMIEGVDKPPRAPWIMSTQERKVFRARISTMRMPTGYGAALRKAFADEKTKFATGLKTHDYHCLLQDILPIAMEGLASEELREAIVDLGILLRMVCGKQIDTSRLLQMDTFGVETLCKLEMALPPSFFDSQIHLLIHLVREVSICGPVHCRWMYWIERYMGFLKGLVRQRAHPEGSMAEGYMHAESISYCMSTMRQLHISCPRSYDDEEEERRTGQVFLGGSETSLLSTVQQSQVHTFILANTESMQPWYARYDMEKNNIRRNMRHSFPKFKEYMKEKIVEVRRRLSLGESVDEFPECTEDVFALVRGPARSAVSYTQMWDKGRHFRVAALDEKVRRTQDSGVCATFFQDSRTSLHDLNLESGELPYYGVIDKILEVDFISFTQVVLYCTWYTVRLRGARATVVRDTCGLTRVDTSQQLRRDRHSDEPFVFPSQVEQCFYTSCVSRPMWSFITPYVPRTRQIVQDNPIVIRTSDSLEADVE